MIRQRTGFIVTNVCAVVHYTGADGQHNKITKAAKAQAADSKTNLTDVQKQALKIKLAKQTISDTISQLKRQGATNCKGSVVTRLFARVGYTDDKGKRHDKVRAAESRTHAKELIKDLLRELEEDGGRTLDASKMTFADLAAYFEEHYLKEAEYVGDRKVAGVRSLKPAQAAIKPLKEHFGKRRRRHNRLRWYQREVRRLHLAELLDARGLKLWEPWPRGTQARIAKELNVSPATISRDVEALQLMQSRRRTSEADPPELASLRASIKLRLAELDQLEQQRSGRTATEKRAT